MRPRCCYLGCRDYGIWQDTESSEVYCGAHSLIVMTAMDEAEIRRERREEAADEERGEKFSAVASRSW